MEKKTPLIFVYLGKKPPKYAKYSLKLAQSNNNRVILLTNTHKGLNDLHDLIEVSVEPNFIKDTTNHFSNDEDNNFRNQFWNLTIDRYEILLYFMKANDLTSIWHAELDNFISDLSNLDSKLDKIHNGMFYPVIEGKHAAGSLVYINNINVLEKFIAFTKTTHDKNDMQLLYEFFILNKKYVYSLPTNLDREIINKIGIFDAAGHGQYLFGIDPRNITKANYNLYINPIEMDSNFNLTTYYYIDKDFFIKDNINRNIKLNNLHIHSKINKRLMNEKYILKVVNRVNLKTRSLIHIPFYKNNFETIIKTIIRRLLHIFS